MALTIIPYKRLGSEFMPPLNEGTILFMPTAVPGMSINETTKVLQIQNRQLKKIPEVLTVFGKAGQAEIVDRSRPALDVRNGRDHEAAESMAAGHDVGQDHRGDEHQH